MSETKSIRYCKKCGCELMSNNKKNLCENCRLKKNQNIKNALIGTGGTVLSIVLLVISGGRINKK